MIFNPSPGSGGGVSSFNTRTGAVVSTTGDYTSDQVTQGSTNLYSQFVPSSWYTSSLVSGISYKSPITNNRSSIALIPNGSGTIADLWLFDSSDVTNNYSAMAWGLEAASSAWGFNTAIHGTGTNHHIYFNATNGQSSTTSNLFCSTNGYVGINTNTPLAPLDVKGYARVLGSAGGTGGVPSSGKGLEFTFDTTTNIGYILPFDRTGTTFQALSILATTVLLLPGQTGNVGIGVSTATGRLHLPAGTSTAGTAPLKLTSGTNLSSPEDGTLEYDGSNLAFTIGSARHNISIPRSSSMADATSITPNCTVNSAQYQANTQSAGTLTVNAPTGSPVDFQDIIIRIKSTNVQTYSFNAIYRGSTDLPLPTSSTGSSKTDYMAFTYNTEDSKWDYIGKIFGF